MKLVRGRHQGHMDAMSEALFKPDSDYLHLTGLKMEDAMVSLQGDVMLVASNPRNTPVRLEEGQLLGQVQPVEWVQQQEDEVTSTPAAGEVSEPKSTGTVCGLQQYDPDQCLEQLFGTLDLDGLYPLRPGRSWREYYASLQTPLRCLIMNWEPPMRSLTPSTKEVTHPSDNLQDAYHFLLGVRWTRWYPAW